MTWRAKKKYTNLVAGDILSFWRFLGVSYFVWQICKLPRTRQLSEKSMAYSNSLKIEDAFPNQGGTFGPAGHWANHFWIHFNLSWFTWESSSSGFPSGSQGGSSWNTRELLHWIPSGSLGPLGHWDPVGLRTHWLFGPVEPWKQWDPLALRVHWPLAPNWYQYMVFSQSVFSQIANYTCIIVFNTTLINNHEHIKTRQK